VGRIDDKRQRRSERRWIQLVQKKPVQRVPCEMQFPGKVVIGANLISVRPRRIHRRFYIPKSVYAPEVEERKPK